MIGPVNTEFKRKTAIGAPVLPSSLLAAMQIHTRKEIADLVARHSATPAVEMDILETDSPALETSLLQHLKR